MISALIVDDEPLARAGFRKLLSAYPDIGVEEAASGEEAVLKARANPPQVLFLDIQMPGMDGFECLEHLSDLEPRPAVVFVTAFDQFAVQAFEQNAIDYLLKPVDPQRLEQTIEKLRASSATSPSTNANESRQPSYLERVQVRVGSKTLLIPIPEIVRFESSEKYTDLYAKNGKYLIDTPLVALETRLDPKRFLRVHRAHIVAIPQIIAIDRPASGKLRLQLKNGDTVPVGRNFVERVREL
jgi:two-component system LytT family response regulator